MKKITLKELSLKNFRGKGARTTTFDPAKTSIAGKNGLGKSRHFDAFLWLLFGKDSQGRKDFNIRTTVKGRPLERVNAEVSGILIVGSEEISLKRIYKEKWVKPRGAIEEKFEGCECELWWNDVPLRVSEYNKRINEIVNEDVFKMLTNPLHFAGMPWQDQRAQLFQLAGIMSDSELAEQNPEFVGLVIALKNKSLTDLKKEISARKKKLKAELDTIQPRIDQTLKLMPEPLDFTQLELEIENLEQQYKEADNELNNIVEAAREASEKIQKRIALINELKTKQQAVVHAAKAEADELNFEAQKEERVLKRDIQELDSDVIKLIESIRLCEKEIKKLDSNAREKQAEVFAKREEWVAYNATEPDNFKECHACQQGLPESHIENSLKIFTETKNKKIDKIRNEGQVLKVELNELNFRINNARSSKENNDLLLSTKKAEMKVAIIKLSELKVAEPIEIINTDLPEFVELSAKIAELEAVDDQETDATPDKLREKRKEITDKLNSVKSELAKKDVIVNYEAEIKLLEAEARQLAQQIASVEQEEFTIQNFTKARIEECESRINNLFTAVQFELFSYTIEGNIQECCTPLVEGVPFGVANTAGRVNAGLEIINALVKYYKVNAPIFIDNSESINSVICTESQIIHLIVTEDKNLVIS